MTKKPLIALLGAYVLLLSLSASAQSTTSRLPRWISDKGYWVIQSNIHTPKQSTVFFYTNEGTLVYKEAVEGRRLNPERRKTRMHLASVLEQSVTAWEESKAPKENQQWLAHRLNQ